MNAQMQQGFNGMNENNNRLTESINETTTNKANDIIANQNANSHSQIDAIEKQNLKCTTYNYNRDNINVSIGALLTGGITDVNTGYRHTNYISVNKDKTYTLTTNWTSNGASYCLYDLDKNYINCNAISSQNINITPQEDGFIRYSLNVNNINTITNFTGEYCYNMLDKQNQQQAEQNAYLQDSSIDSSSMSGFNVSFDYGGVTGVLTAPLNAINSILSNTCTDLVFTLPFINKQITLPCLTPIYQTHASGLLSLYQTVITGIVSYWICLNIFKIIKGFSDPEEDRIEVLEL